MNRNLQLRIPAPCHEDWNAMRPEEKGRFCGACSKTVMDFSMMTDQEVIRYLGQANSRVCGRLAPEQLNREILLAAGGRPRRRWWRWLLAGLLVTAEARGQAVTKAEVKTEKSLPVKADSMKVQVLDTVKVIGYGVTTRRDIVGEIGGVRGTEVTAGEVLYGYAGGIVYSVRVYRIWEMAKDSLAAVGLMPKRELAVYPNPARRGSVVSLQWRRTEPGNYEVSLFNAAGAVVERRKIEVGGKEQVDLLSLPPALPAGMYFLRAARPDGAKVITLRIILI